MSSILNFYNIPIYDIINAFVLVYGEANRSIIEQKIINALILIHDLNSSIDMEVYENFIDQLYNLNLKGSKLKDLYDAIKEQRCCVIPGYIERNNIIIPKPILLFSYLGALDKYRNISFIHELVHIVELSIYIDSIGRIIYRTGFALLSEDSKSKINKYSFINEIIVQEIARMITEIVHMQGIVIFEEPSSSLLEGGTIYELKTEAIIEYFNENITEILNARITGKYDDILKWQKRFEIILKKQNSNLLT